MRRQRLLFLRWCRVCSCLQPRRWSYVAGATRQTSAERQSTQWSTWVTNARRGLCCGKRQLRPNRRRQGRHLWRLAPVRRRPPVAVAARSSSAVVIGLRAPRSSDGLWRARCQLRRGLGWLRQHRDLRYLHRHRHLWCGGGQAFSVARAAAVPAPRSPARRLARTAADGRWLWRHAELRHRAGGMACGAGGVAGVCGSTTCTPAPVPRRAPTAATSATAAAASSTTTPPAPAPAVAPARAAWSAAALAANVCGTPTTTCTTALCMAQKTLPGGWPDDHHAHRQGDGSGSRRHRPLGHPDPIRRHCVRAERHGHAVLLPA